MKKIPLNYILFGVLIFVFEILVFISLIAAAAEDEGTNGTHPISILLAKLFYVLRFPSHTLLWEFILNNNIFFVSLFLNGLFYAFITERIISYVQYNLLNK